MSYEDLNMNQLQQMALAYVGDSQTDGHYLPQVSLWLNEAQKIMVGDLGIQDTWTSNSIATQRSYPMPPGWAKVKMVTYDGYPLRFCAQMDQDFFDTGTTYPDRFSIWQNQLWLGSLPPDANFPIMTFYYREPLNMVVPTDRPEVPNRFRAGLADWAGSKMAMADNDVALARELRGLFEGRKREFRDWITTQSTQTMQVRNVTDGWSGGYGFR